MPCWGSSTTSRWPTGGPRDTTPDRRPRASLGDDPHRGILHCIFVFLDFLYFCMFILLPCIKKWKYKKIAIYKKTKNIDSTLYMCVVEVLVLSLLKWWIVALSYISTRPSL
jgi:hypothetical protein